MRVQVNHLLMLALWSMSQMVPASAPARSDRLKPLAQTTECTLIPNARIMLTNLATNRPAWVSGLQVANYGHEVAAGHGTVIAVRQFGGANAPVDSATFVKITLALQSTDMHLKEGQKRKVLVSEGFYVSGGVGFLHKRRYWQAQLPVSEVTVSRNASGISMSLNSTFTAKFAANGKAKQVALSVTCEASEKSVQALNPWEGKPGTTWGSFAPRP